MQIKVAAGTTDKLAAIGVRDTSDLVSRTFPNMPVVRSGWAATSAFFKAEGNQINIGLGRGAALDLFNSSIVEFNAIPR